MPDESDVLSNRINDLELLLMQLQRDFESLNEVVLSQQRDLERCRALLRHFETRLDGLSDPEPPRDPLAERPPHY